jgi:hypothetical protein
MTGVSSTVQERWLMRPHCMDAVLKKWPLVLDVYNSAVENEY